MLALTVAIAAWSVFPGASADSTGAIGGVVVNGSQRGAILAGAEVVLRAGRDGPPTPVAQTTADASGRFLFSDLPVDQGLTYLAGANRDGVHYPGPRVRLDPARPQAEVTLTAYDTVAEPSPLVVKRHEVAIEVQKNLLRVTESLVVSNPGRYTYVGAATGDRTPDTWRLSIPADFLKATFHKEFYGRNFRIADGALATSIPWPPGEREVTFTYLLPIEQRSRLWRRVLDSPTEDLSIRVAAAQSEPVACNLPRAGDDGSGCRVFAASESLLPPGREIRVNLGQLPVPWTAYAKWIAPLVLAALVGVLVALSRGSGRDGRTPAPPHLPDHRRIDHGHKSRKGLRAPLAKRRRRKPGRT